MSKKKKTTARVISQRMIAEGIYDLWLATDMAGEARAGQFVGVYPKDKAHLLPRPISICETDKEKGALRLVYRIAGEGTREFAAWQSGEEISVLGVLGNGFPRLEEISSLKETPLKASEAGPSKELSDRISGQKRVVLMGGGIGLPPMLELSKELAAAGNRPLVIAGYRDGQLFLKEDLEKYGEVLVATEDGSAGIKGNVLTAMEMGQAGGGAVMADVPMPMAAAVAADVIMACGPMPMLRAIKKYARERGIPAYISLEERMACGVGACLGCVCRTAHKDSHSHVNNARICTDGPVFEAGEVEI